MENFGIVTYAAITVICYLIGQAIKVSKAPDKVIPVVMGACGAGLGVACYFGLPDFAGTVIDGIAIGVVSGFAATGVNQVYKQLGGPDDTQYTIVNEDVTGEPAEFNSGITIDDVDPTKDETGDA